MFRRTILATVIPFASVMAFAVEAETLDEPFFSSSVLSLVEMKSTTGKSGMSIGGFGFGIDSLNGLGGWFNQFGHELDSGLTYKGSVVETGVGGFANTVEWGADTLSLGLNLGADWVRNNVETAADTLDSTATGVGGHLGSTVENTAGVVDSKAFGLGNKIGNSANQIGLGFQEFGMRLNYGLTNVNSSW